MRRTNWICGIVGTAALAMVLTMGSRAMRAQETGQPAAGGREVQIDNFSFSPGDVTIAAGTTVTWTNHDDVPHTIASEAKAFKSQVLDTNDQFTYTFSKAGTYQYFCTIHPKMTARIVVQ